MSAGLDVSGRERRSPVIANVFSLGETLRRPSRGPRAWPSWPPHGRLLIGTLVAVFILTLILVLTDAWAIENARTLPAWAARLFAVITDYGKSSWFLVPLAVALAGLALLVGPRLGRSAELLSLSIAVRLIFMFAAIGLPGLFVTILKRLIGRARPFVGGEADPYLFTPLGWSAKFASLPSGHSTTAFAAAVALGAIWPRARPFMWCFAVLIGVSRVAVIAHHPSDVIAGALAGTIGAILVRDWFAARRLGFVIAENGLVRAKPMPTTGRLKRLAARLFGH